MERRANPKVTTEAYDKFVRSLKEQRRQKNIKEYQDRFFKKVTKQKKEK